MLMKKSICIAGIVIGICLLGVAALFYKEETKAISGVALGLGAGLLGASIANLIMKIYEEKNPDLMKRNEIEYKDERNTLIRNRAKAAAADIIQWFIMGITGVTILVQAPLWMSMLTVGVYALYHILTLIFIGKYQKEL